MFFQRLQTFSPAFMIQNKEQKVWFYSPSLTSQHSVRFHYRICAGAVIWFSWFFFSLILFTFQSHFSFWIFGAKKGTSYSILGERVRITWATSDGVIHCRNFVKRLRFSQVHNSTLYSVVTFVIYSYNKNIHF